MKINIVNALLQPVPSEERLRLIDKAGVPGLWKNKRSTVYSVLLPFALYHCKKMELPSEIAHDCVQKTCVEICEIAHRDGRKAVLDKRRSNKKPKFTDWVEYAGWVLGRLKLNLKNAHREHFQEQARLRERQQNYLHLLKDALPAKKTAVVNYDKAKLSRA